MSDFFLIVETLRGCTVYPKWNLESLFLENVLIKPLCTVNVCQAKLK